MVNNAKNYKNTIEFCAEKTFDMYNDKYCDGRCKTKFKDILETDKEYFKDCSIAVLDAVNYFEGKQCKDCGYFDQEKSVCFGEDREHQECASSPICETFAPTELVIVKEE